MSRNHLRFAEFGTYFGTRFYDRPAGDDYNIDQPQTNGAPGGSPPKRESLTWGIHLRG
jgi:hypothetical protein